MNVTQADVQHARDLYNAGQLSQMFIITKSGASVIDGAAFRVVVILDLLFGDQYA